MISFLTSLKKSLIINFDCVKSSSRYDSLAEKAKESLELTMIEKLVTSSDLFASPKANKLYREVVLSKNINSKNVYVGSSSRYDSLAEKAKESLELTVIE